MTTTSGASGPREPRAEALPAQHGVVWRLQPYAVGLTRSELRAQVRARRWQRVGTQSVALSTGPLPRVAREWAAVFEAGPRAFLDGASSLVQAGCGTSRSAKIRVSVPRGARVRRGRGLDVRQTRRWAAEDLADGAARRGAGRR